MLAFAANSILCRMALRGSAIDPASFSAVRIVSGAVVLVVILAARGRARAVTAGSWPSALMLCAYAVCFSFAYVSLGAATGALILFGTVQGTMITVGLAAGDRPRAAEWVGWTVAAVGLAWLLVPGLESPPAAGAALMALAGVAWGLYSIRGKGEADATGATCGNFVRAAPAVLLISAITFGESDIGAEGLLLAVISGAITSGLGYVVWYSALALLTSMQAALVQLTVPVLAALGGVLVLDESLTTRLVIAGGLILGGIAVALVGRAPPRSR